MSRGPRGYRIKSSGKLETWFLDSSFLANLDGFLKDRTTLHILSMGVL